MAANLLEAIGNLEPAKLQELVELSQKESQRIRAKLGVAKFSEKIRIYYMMTKEITVDRTEELHIPHVTIELAVSDVETLDEAEALAAKMIDAKDARLHPVVGNCFELPNASVWKQVAEKLLSNTLPKSFFEPEKQVDQPRVLESDDV